MKPTKKGAERRPGLEVTAHYKSVKKFRPAAGIALAALKAAGCRKAGINLIFVKDAYIKRINAGFRSKNKATDVISFPYGGGKGDIFISAETAARQARENGISAAEEIKNLIVHGILHVLGYDHEKSSDKGRMMRKQKIILKKI